MDRRAAARKRPHLRLSTCEHNLNPTQARPDTSTSRPTASATKAVAAERQRLRLRVHRVRVNGGLATKGWLSRAGLSWAAVPPRTTFVWIQQSKQSTSKARTKKHRGEPASQPAGGLGLGCKTKKLELW